MRRSRMLRPVGVAAYRAADRMLPAAPGPRVVVNSMPKSGTHLVSELLDQLGGMRFSGHAVMFIEARRHRDTDKALAVVERRARRLRPSHYMGSHLTWDPRVESILTSADVRLVTILRDPRALVVSAKNYLYKATWMPHRDRLIDWLGDERSVMEFAIRGHGDPGDAVYVPDLGTHFHGYVRWLDSPAGLTVRFEDLVGPQGGGTTDAQNRAVGQILDHLGLREGDEPIEEVAARVFSDRSITFHGGQSDAWRSELPNDLQDEVLERCADDMRRLGYA
jgi:hypothetical protein